MRRFCLLALLMTGEGKDKELVERARVRSCQRLSLPLPLLRLEPGGATYWHTPTCRVSWGGKRDKKEGFGHPLQGARSVIWAPIYIHSTQVTPHLGGLKTLPV